MSGRGFRRRGPDLRAAEERRALEAQLWGQREAEAENSLQPATHTITPQLVATGMMDIENAVAGAEKERPRQALPFWDWCVWLLCPGE